MTASLVAKSEEEYKSCFNGESEQNSRNLNDTLSKIKEKCAEKRDEVAARS